MSQREQKTKELFNVTSKDINENERKIEEIKRQLNAVKTELNLKRESLNDVILERKESENDLLIIKENKANELNELNEIKQEIEECNKNLKRKQKELLHKNSVLEQTKTELEKFGGFITNNTFFLQNSNMFYLFFFIFIFFFIFFFFLWCFMRWFLKTKYGNLRLQFEMHGCVKQWFAKQCHAMFLGASYIARKSTSLKGIVLCL